MFLAAAVVPTSLKKAEGSVELEIPESSGKHGKKPILLECDSSIARSLDGRHIFIESVEDSSSRYGSFISSPFSSFLEGLNGDGEPRYLLFLVRPQGLGVYRTLKAKLRRRNLEMCASSTNLGESISQDTIQRIAREFGGYVEYDDGKLTLLRKLTMAQREKLKTYFASTSTMMTLDRLFEESQAKPEWIDYGLELLPASWEIKAVK